MAEPDPEAVAAFEAWLERDSMAPAVAIPSRPTDDELFDGIGASIERIRALLAPMTGPMF